MPDEQKVTVEQALDKATEELSASETEKPEAPAPEETPTQGDETPQGDTPSEGESEPEAAAGEPSDAIDKAIRDSVGRFESGEGPSKSSKEKLTDLLVDHLKTEILSKGRRESGPPDISQVDTRDPSAVQGYVDSRISHMVNSALKPLQNQLSIYQAEAEYRNLITKYPDSAVKYGKRIAAMINKNPSLDLETAYKSVAYDDMVKTGVKKAYDSMSKKKAATLTTSTVRSPVDMPKKPKTAREAVLMAMDEVGATFGEA